MKRVLSIIKEIKSKEGAVAKLQINCRNWIKYACNCKQIERRLLAMPGLDPQLKQSTWPKPETFAGVWAHRQTCRLSNQTETEPRSCRRWRRRQWKRERRVNFNKDSNCRLARIFVAKKQFYACKGMKSLCSCLFHVSLASAAATPLRVLHMLRIRHVRRTRMKTKTKKKSWKWK